MISPITHVDVVDDEGDVLAVADGDGAVLVGRVLGARLEAEVGRGQGYDLGVLQRERLESTDVG